MIRRTSIPMSSIVLQFDVKDLSFFNGYILLWFITVYCLYVYNMNKRLIINIGIGNIFSSLLTFFTNFVTCYRLVNKTLTKRRETVIKAYDYLNGKMFYSAFYKY